MFLIGAILNLMGVNLKKSQVITLLVVYNLAFGYFLQTHYVNYQSGPSSRFGFDYSCYLEQASAYW